jgi:hypothetical protein
VDPEEGRQLAALFVREGIPPVTFVHVSSTGRRLDVVSGWVLQHASERGGPAGGLALSGDGLLYRCSHRLVRPWRRIWGEPVDAPDELVTATVISIVDGSYRQADEAHLRRVKRLPVVTLLILLPVAAEIALLAAS